MDFPTQGIGDIVLACWILNSIRDTASSVQLKLNPRGYKVVPEILGIDAAFITDESGADFSETAGLGHLFEFEQVANGQPAGKSRFHHWCESLGLGIVEPRRPNYAGDAEALNWAREEWRGITDGQPKKRILIFPKTAWLVRQWPKAYFMDIVDILQKHGYAVAAMGSTSQDVDYMNCKWYYGFDLSRVSAMMALSDYVIGCDSGPAHLSGALGKHTLAICGPTQGSVVFGHDPCVETIALDPSVLDCVGCHFSPAKSYRSACGVGGCQALMRLSPEIVLQSVRKTLEA